jgi:hypothetical protein
MVHWWPWFQNQDWVESWCMCRSIGDHQAWQRITCGRRAIQRFTSFMITHVHTFAWMNQHTWRALYNYCVHVALCSWYGFSMSLLCENSPCQQLEQCMRSYTYVSVQRHAEPPQGRHLGDISNMFMHFIRSALQQWIGCK